MKYAFITGIGGQDGSYLAELLLDKNYKVYGLMRRSSVDNTYRLNGIKSDPNLHISYGDITDIVSITQILKQIKNQPDVEVIEIYNLAAQSDVYISFIQPIHTTQVNATGTLNVLEAVRQLDIVDKTKIYQASTSELFGKVEEIPQNEKTPLHPRSPYGVSKLYSYWLIIQYREAYNMFCCNGILFNHESPRRGLNFVSRKITNGLARIFKGEQDCIYLGNLYAKRDWGHAKDYVEAMYLMLQQSKPEDLVISTGVNYSVKQFTEKTASRLGYKLQWKGTELDEIGFIKKDGKEKIIIRVDPQYYRPSEVDILLGDSTRAREILKWKPNYDLDEMITEMLQYDLNNQNFL
jgi:GDPmannose 4,6-dehydratase